MDAQNGPGGGDYYENKAAAAAIILVEGEELYLERRREREASLSVGRSWSGVYYCRRAEGVPFKWEKKPGTPNSTTKVDGDDIIIPVVLPLSPPPSLQSLGLPLPCFHHHNAQPQKSKLHAFSWRKIKKIMLQQRAKMIIIIGKKSGGGGGLQEEHKSTETTNHQRQNYDTDFIASSSLNSSSSSCSSSSSSSSSSSNGPFCYGSPWNMKAAAIMDEEAAAGNKSIRCSRYYSKELPPPPHRHKAFFRLQQQEDEEEEEDEDDGYGFSSLLSSRLSSSYSSRFYYCMSSSTAHQPGIIIPFQWEMQPGAPKTPPENDVIPPPCPPPLAQSLALPKPKPLQSETTAITYSSPCWTWTKFWKLGNKRLMAARKKKLKDKEMRRNHHSLPLPASSSNSKILLKFRKQFLGKRCSCIGPWIGPTN